MSERSVNSSKGILLSVSLNQMIKFHQFMVEKGWSTNNRANTKLSFSFTNIHNRRCVQYAIQTKELLLYIFAQSSTFCVQFATFYFKQIDIEHSSRYSDSHGLTAVLRLITTRCKQWMNNVYPASTTPSLACCRSAGWKSLFSCDSAVNRAIVVSKPFFPDLRKKRSRLKRSIDLLMNQIVLWYANNALWQILEKLQENVFKVTSFSKWNLFTWLVCFSPATVSNRS